MALIYPAGDEQQTLNLGLATWGMDEVLAQNMILIDAFAGGPFGTAVKINGSVVTNPNFVNSASVTFSVIGSNVSAIASGGNEVFTAAAPTVAAAQVGLGSTTAATASAGGGQALPGTVLGYLVANVAGTTVKIPYYSA